MVCTGLMSTAIRRSTSSGCLREPHLGPALWQARLSLRRGSQILNLAIQGLAESQVDRWVLRVHTGCGGSLTHPLECQQHGRLASHAVANEDAGHEAQLGQEVLQVLAHGLVAHVWAVGAVTMVPCIHREHLRSGERAGRAGIHVPGTDSPRRGIPAG